MVPRRIVRRALLASAIGAPLGVVLLWIAIHRVSWLGPWLANGLRSVIGTAAVARLEETVYRTEDRVNRIWRKDEPPKAQWHAEADDREQPETLPQAPETEVPSPPAFRPKDVGPMVPRVSTPLDGVWMPIHQPDRGIGAPVLYKTQLHPDARRPWAELFVVAVDLRRARLHAVAGSRDPESTRQEARAYVRPAVVPEQHHDRLLAAFNGGFKTEHGQFGMKVDGVTLVRPLEAACTIAAYEDGAVAIASWKKIAKTEPEMLWWRQAPPCFYQNGKMHGALWEDEITRWGAAVGGDVVIRRSAIGLGAGRDVLYVGISNFTTARAIAQGMHHAGGNDVAQLDVNWSYPKFLVYRKDEAGALQADVLVEGFVFEADEYLKKRSPRDFFYIVRDEVD
jgi:hypothetical protein